MEKAQREIFLCFWYYLTPLDVVFMTIMTILGIYHIKAVIYWKHVHFSTSFRIVLFLGQNLRQG